MKQQIMRLHTAPGVCSKCGSDLSEPRKKPCRGQVCKSCKARAQREWVKANRKTTRARERERTKRRREQNPIRILLTQVRSRCKRRGISFDLVESDLVVPETCPLLGIKLAPGDRWTSPSLDRFDPDKGYVKGNVWVISARANTIKNNASVDELARVASGLRAEASRRFRAQSNQWFKKAVA